MKISLKVFIFVVLILSLSIIAIPQNGECVTACEYELPLCGTVASISRTGGQFTPTTMSIVWDSCWSDGVTDSYATGKMTLVNLTTNKITGPIPVSYYTDSAGKVFITTKAGQFASGEWVPDVGLSLVWQDPSTGATGKFILCPPSPAIP